MTKPLFRGVCASSITSFRPDGSLWLERLKSHIDWLIDERVDAIFPLGSSGEFPAMGCVDRERISKSFKFASPSCWLIPRAGHECVQ
jgi:4-hydroxy-tetrahydrodipicolinate synthase